MKPFFYSVGILFAAVILLPSLGYKNSDSTREHTTDTDEEKAEISVITSDSAVTMDLEEYITGVVLAEMPASYSEEALKAQAVAARTYAVSKMRSNAHEGGAICTDYSCCQAYISPSEYSGDSSSLEKVKSAVLATKGEIMTYNSEPIVAVFHSMSAGKTTSAEAAWGSDVPYLVAVDSPLEANEESFETTVSLPIDEFIRKLKTAVPEYDGSLDISLPERDASGYVKSLSIGGFDFSGNTMRNLFSLRSSNFNLGIEGQNAVFTVFGYGHGVGMSQHGAKLLAENGKDYKEILSTYYTGISIEKAKAP